jgi:hypothetical protein
MEEPMPDKPRREYPAPIKKPARSGLYSWVSSKKLPQGRAFQAIRRELTAVRGELVAQHGGEKITPDALILCDSIVEALGVQKLLGLYVRKYGVINALEAKRGRLELSPILSKNWISYGNTVRQAILALRELDKGQGRGDDVPTIAEIIRECDEEEAAAQAARAKEAATRGPALAQDERSAAGQDGGKGREGADPGGNGQGGEKRASVIDGDGRSPDDEARDMGAGQGEEASHGDE